MTVMFTNLTRCFARTRRAVGLARLPLAIVPLLFVLSNASGASAAKWSLQTTQNPAGAFSSTLSGVSCGAESSCLAVGRWAENNKLENEPLAELWNGTAWKLTTPKKPTGSVAALESVSCPSEKECTATGGYKLEKEAPALAERYNNGEWALQSVSAPVTGATTWDLSGVSCPTTTRCISAGFYKTTGVENHLLVESWNGTSWSKQEAPEPSVKELEATVSISCTSTTFCMLADSGVVEGHIQAFVERWNGTKWTFEAVPLPSGFENSHGLAVSCTSATSCYVAGWGRKTAKVPIVEFWNGEKWTLQTLPTISGSAVLNGISCHSGSVCEAAGFHANENEPIAYGLNAGSWTLQETAKPKGGLLWGISCPAELHCIAVGSQLPSTTTETLAELFS
jgi:hypothetical protein